MMVLSEINCFAFISRFILAAVLMSPLVMIQHIITKGTIDERILKALEAKDRTQAALIDAVKVALEV